MIAEIMVLDATANEIGFRLTGRQAGLFSGFKCHNALLLARTQALVRISLETPKSIADRFCWGRERTSERVRVQINVKKLIS